VVRPVDDAVALRSLSLLWVLACLGRIPCGFGTSLPPNPKGLGNAGCVASCCPDK
jgi:hypothetical protein